MDHARSIPDKGEGESEGTIYVIGAGIVGLCVAWHLQRRGARVAVIDREEPARGCSFGNAGALSSGSVAPLAMPGIWWTAPSMLLDPDGPIHVPFHYWLKAAPWLLHFSRSSQKEKVARIAQALAFLLSDAIEQHQHILERAGSADLIRRSGQLHLYRNMAHLNTDQASWSLRRRHGLRTELMERNQFLELEPTIGARYQVAVFTPEQGMSLDPYRQTLAIAGDFVRNGGRIVKKNVTGIEVDGDRLRSIRTESGTINAERIVLCAGAWSAELLRPLGYNIPLETQRGYHVMVAGPNAGIGRPVVLADRKVFVTPMQDGVRAAGTVEFGGLNLPPTRRRAELLVKHFADAFPELASDMHRELWMGHRPCLPDSLPVLGESQWHRGLWFAFGHGHLGLTASAKSGKLVAEAMATSQSLEAYSIHRFPGGAVRKRLAAA